ncbi:hypothetical protein GGQ81_002670 [Sphingomonas desiccabilis]|nr:hypothetical protein [Sphingomonas desiccabilis]
MRSFLIALASFVTTATVIVATSVPFAGGIA